ncbi:hypothetical protein KR222_009091 [Zaprionus bogoriensis]|nr:hypothetical protein KR222_009091 [Zaprionus bogoriensis]
MADTADEKPQEENSPPENEDAGSPKDTKNNSPPPENEDSASAKDNKESSSPPNDDIPETENPPPADRPPAKENSPPRDRKDQPGSPEDLKRPSKKDDNNAGDGDKSEDGSEPEEEAQPSNWAYGFQILRAIIFFVVGFKIIVGLTGVVLWRSLDDGR